MAKQIKRNDIAEDDIFALVKSSATSAIEKVDALNTELTKVGTSFKEGLGKLKTDSSGDIDKLVKKVKELTELTNIQTKALVEQEKVYRAQKQTIEQGKREEAKTEDLLNRQKERANKLANDQANAYKQLEKNTRELKNASKQLGAEMLELERNGKRNTAEYYKLEQQYKKVTQSALEGDKALKKLDQSVGDNFRSVGNYTKALGGLKNMFFQLVGAFGAVDLVKFLVGTQVKLDSLNLALRNVSGSTKEYQANFAFLKDLSLSYGQDLLGLISTYKNFIASTTESNLTLGERRRIYESVIKAGSALALSNDDIQGSLRAVQQMFSKGTIQAEELRQQLGDRLPGAFGIMAKAVGVTEAELGKMMKNGEVFADDIMPRFAVLLEEEFGKKASLNLETLNGAFNVLKTNITLYFDQAQKNISVNKTLAFLLRKVGENIGVLLTAIRQLTTAFITYKMLAIAISTRNKIMATSFKEVASSALKGGEAIKLFGLSFKQIALIGVIDGIVKLTEYFIDLSKGTDLARLSYERFQNARKGGDKKATKFLTDEKTKLDNYRYEQEALKKSGEINEVEYKKRIKLAEEERIQNIRIKNQELQDKVKLYKDEQAKMRELNDGKEIAKPIAPIGVKTKIARPGAVVHAITNLVDGEKSDEQKWFEKQEKIYKKSLELWNSYNKLGANAYDVQIQINTLNGELEKYDVINQKTTRDVKDAHYVYKPYLKDLRDAKIEYKTINDYLSRQVELFYELSVLQARIKADKATSAYEDELKIQQEQVGLTGEYNSGKLSQLKQQETDALIKLEGIERERVFQEMNKTHEEKVALLNKNLQIEKEEYLKKYSDLRDRMNIAIENADRKEFNAQNATKKGKAKALVDAKEARAFADAQKKIYEDATQEANEKFIEAQKDLDRKALKERGDILDAQAIMTEESEDKIKKIRQKAREDWSAEEKALVKAHDEFELERIKRISETANSFIQNSLEYYIRTAETRIKQLDTYMTKLSNQMDFLQAKVASGSITAQESLAKVEQEQQEAEKRKLKEQRKAQRLQMAQTVFNAYNSNVQNSKVGENALTKTLSDVTLLSAFIGSLPTYFDGTEDTGTNGQGLDGKGGFHAILHPNERVIPKELNMKMGDLSNIEIAKLAEDKVRGNIMSRGEGAISLMNNSWQTELIISELKDLKNTIKNKPETNVEVGEILGGVMKIVETKKMGNQTTRNITRLS